MTGNQTGALLMMGSMAAFTFNDTLVKLAGEELPLPQILVVRGLAATLLIFVLARMLGSLRLRLPAAAWGLVSLRCLAEAGATYLFLTALMRMPLANVTAVLQGLPLTVTLGAALIFAEPVGWRRAAAIAAGFLGMLLIVRPGPDGFGDGALYAIGAVACVTVRDLSTRRMPANVPSMTVTLMAALTVTVFGLLLSAGTEWQPMDARSGGLLISAALFIFAGYLCSVMTMRVGEVAVVAPLRYSGLLWALLLGWVVFGHWPDAVTLLGAAVVVAAGGFTFYRERRLAGRARGRARQGPS
ncbi:DMT family transporter [Cribrihabitans neustonicus]|uniref:DMT family transporter n=1 Tax=Cribrihabitans neustonicus TaxID=1429085 RepID=UPI003B5A58B6